MCVGEEPYRVDIVWDSQLCCLQDCLGSLHAQETFVGQAQGGMDVQLALKGTLGSGL